MGENWFLVGGRPKKPIGVTGVHGVPKSYSIRTGMWCIGIKIPWEAGILGKTMFKKTPLGRDNETLRNTGLR